MNADMHQLLVGTSPGGRDLFDSGQILATNAAVSGLPATGVLYARALSRVRGMWRHADIAFTLQASSPVAGMLVPVGGQIGFDTVHPFEWSPAPLGQAYRLTVGTALGMSDLDDSGEIHITRRFVLDLPVGVPLYGRLQTKIGGQWSARDFTFSVGANTVSTALQIESALWATDQVRQMASTDNLPFGWTVLATAVARRIPLRFSADCLDFAQALLDVMVEMNAQLPVRRLDIAMNPNSYDAHTLVEMFNPDSQTLMLLDPTFDLTVKRTTDQQWATAEDMSTATRAKQWGDVSYVYLGERGDYYARNYYLDYPLLFVNVYHAGQFPVFGQGGPVLPYMVQVATPVSGTNTTYAVGCSSVQSTVLRVDGLDQTIDCSGVDGVSYAFSANAIETTSQTAASTIVYRVSRFRF